MIEKIKINLSFVVYIDLMRDMLRFNYFKPNATLNHNEFLNTVIYYFYRYKLHKRLVFESYFVKYALFDDMSTRNKEKMINAAALIMDDFYNEDLLISKHKYSFTIYPTKKYEEFYDILYENEVQRNNMSMSSFLRRLLNEYIRLPVIQREIIACNRNFDLIQSCCKNKTVAVIETRNMKYRIALFSISPNLSESENYVLGIDLKSSKKKPIAFKLNKIIRVVKTREIYKFTKEETETLYKICENGVEYATGEFINVKVKLTKSGIKMFGYMLDHKPTVINVEGDVYTLKCTVSNFMNYFSAFGKEFTILDNDELKQKMLNFFKNAYLNLEKDS